MIGASASGKSTLARVITGIWRPYSGAVRLDGAALSHYEPDVLGSYIGYLPQDVVLFDGTVAENIARMQASPNPAAVVAAAKKAGAHEMILRPAAGLRHAGHGRRLAALRRPEAAHRRSPAPSTATRC